MCRRSSLLTGEDGGGAKSYDGKKALSSINNSIPCEVDSSRAETEDVNCCGIERLKKKLDCCGLGVKEERVG